MWLLYNKFFLVYIQHLVMTNMHISVIVSLRYQSRSRNCTGILLHLCFKSQLLTAKLDEAYPAVVWGLFKRNINLWFSYAEHNTAMLEGKVFYPYLGSMGEERTRWPQFEGS